MFKERMRTRCCRTVPFPSQHSLPMPKSILTILLFCCALHSWGQDSRNNAAALNKKADTQANKLEHVVFRDSVLFYHQVVEVVKLSLQCDEQDRMPNRKGEVKPRYEKDNSKRLSVFRPQLIDAGIYFVKSHLRDEGVAAWQLYLRSALNPLMKNEPDETGIAAYYIAQTELAARSYKAADRYADIALRYDETAQQGAEIKAQCMSATMVTAEDSLRYLAVLTQLYKTDPTNQEYFSWIMQFYSHPSKQFDLTQFVDQQLEDNSKSYVPWVLKGEIAMNAERWDEAIQAYQQADELRPELIPIIYNIAVCLNNKVLAMQQEREGTKSEREGLLAQSRNYLERVRVLDPYQRQVQWVAPLYLVYKLLDDKVHADELEPIVNKFKTQ